MLNYKQMGALTATLAIGFGCSERDTSTLEPAPPSTDPVVFDDTFGAAVDYQAFLGSRLDALSIDNTRDHSTGTASLRAYVPGPDDLDLGTFAGGAFVTALRRDLTGYNALTFWARSNQSTTLNTAQLGNDNTGFSKYIAEVSDVPLTEAWSKVIVPIPFPSRLSEEGGLFAFAEGWEDQDGHDVWFDDVKFELLDGITSPQPSFTAQSVLGFVGNTVQPEGAQTIFDVDGEPRLVTHQPGYFTFTSSDEAVATTTADGDILVVGTGTATLTAKLGNVDVEGQITLNAIAPPSEPAPVPTTEAINVLSLFSDAYDDQGVDSFHSFGPGRVTELDISGDAIKAYTGLTFAGIQITGTLDASEMTHVHMDVWMPGGADFKLKLVDFGGDGVFGGGDDSEHELTFNAASDPPLLIGEWVSLDIAIDRFTTLASTNNLAQVIISSASSSTVFIDNIYFRK